MNTLEIGGLTVAYGHGRHAVTAVDDVSLAVAPGKVYGLVGESGSGKSTLARATVGLIPAAAGTITVAGQRVAGESRRARQERARRVQLVFQDPYSSLDPRMTIRQIILESLRLRTDLAAGGADAEIARLLELVNLEPAYARRLPRELSGGQRQRVAIARALAVRPKLIVADEITSALDVSVQAHVLNVIREIQRAEGLSMLFISHNLATVRYISDEIGVMYRGRLVESGPTERVVEAPTHEYTRELLRAVPVLRVPSSPLEAAS
ncbi:ABC transporter ATP-binding protein [Dactylosporangium darangshiense]|uniref:ABC transporter ATP-binding protein n=1 Tax=Dactylosporangium darangshiense TaxID=579108 RepID=A0ABP8DD19_9ACTN